MDNFSDSWDSPVGSLSQSRPGVNLTRVAKLSRNTLGRLVE